MTNLRSQYRRLFEGRTSSNDSNLLREDSRDSISYAIIDAIEEEDGARLEKYLQPDAASEADTATGLALQVHMDLMRNPKTKPIYLKWAKDNYPEVFDPRYEGDTNPVHAFSDELVFEAAEFIKFGYDLIKKLGIKSKVFK